MFPRHSRKYFYTEASFVEEAFEEMMTYPAAPGNFSSHPDEKVSLRAIELSASFPVFVYKRMQRI